VDNASLHNLLLNIIFAPPAWRRQLPSNPEKPEEKRRLQTGKSKGTGLKRPATRKSKSARSPQMAGTLRGRGFAVRTTDAPP
jgi:hypothetical protein